jgi:hypothetical protein
MKDLWLKISCFLTGYNYDLIKNSSWISKAIVLKNMSALLCTCLIWAIVGFIVGKRFLTFAIPGCLLSSGCLLFIAIQIERQIIMSSSKRPLLLIFRTFMGLNMALLGALIMDQVVFSSDIDKEKIELVNSQVDSLLRNRTIKDKIRLGVIDGLIQEDIEKRSLLIQEISRLPTLKLIDSESLNSPQSNSETAENHSSIHQITSRTIVNPNIQVINLLESDLNKLREEKLAILKKEELDRQVLTSKILSTRNFLEDSKILFSIIKENTFAMLFWLSLTLLLFTLEMLVLINKIGEPKNDYDKRLDWELDQNMQIIEY